MQGPRGGPNMNNNNRGGMNYLRDRNNHLNRDQAL